MAAARRRENASTEAGRLATSSTDQEDLRASPCRIEIALNRAESALCAERRREKPISWSPSVTENGFSRNDLRWSGVDRIPAFSRAKKPTGCVPSTTCPFQNGRWPA